MSIVKLLEDNQPPFSTLNISQALIDNTTIDRGLLIELYVQTWISQTPLINTNPKFPKQKWIYTLNKTQLGQFYGNNFFTDKIGFEFDGLFEYNGKIHAYEVKSNKLRDFTYKIPRNLNIMKLLFSKQQIGEFLIFYRMKCKYSQMYAQRLTQQFNQEIAFINLGYSNKQLKQFIKRKEKKLQEEILVA